MSTDDSICESSLPPNKSSGDIVERLRNRLQRDRRGNFDPELSLRLGPGIYEEIMESAAEIERLRRERDEARQLVTEANNSLFGSQAYFHSMNGGPFDRYHLSRGIEQIKDDARRHWQESQAAEPAVAAAWEEAADWLAAQYPDNVNTNAFCAALRSHVRPSVFAHPREDIAVMPEGIEQAIQLRTASEIEQERRASAIRAAGADKTAESGHSPSTHNSESE